MTIQLLEMVEIDKAIAESFARLRSGVDLSSTQHRELVMMRLEIAKLQAMRDLAAELGGLNAWIQTNLGS